MTIWTHDRLKAKKWQGWKKQPFEYLTYKYDGRRVTLFQQANGELHAFSRDNRPHLDMREKLLKHDWFQKAERNLPPFSSLDGELWVKTGKRSDVVTAINDGNPNLTFTMFAVPYWNNVAWHLIPSTLEFVDAIALKTEQRAGAWISSEGLHDFSEEAMFALLDNINSAQAYKGEGSIEGFVFKNSQYDQWYKFKKEDTVDAIVTGVLWSNAITNIGLIGSLVMSVYQGDKFIEIATCSGMNQDEREYMSTEMREGRLVGRVAEIKYQMVGAGGRLVHPRFINFRDDKPKEECLYSQLDKDS